MYLLSTDSALEGCEFPLTSGVAWGILHFTGADPQSPIHSSFCMANLGVPNIIFFYLQGLILILCMQISSNVLVGQWYHARRSRMWAGDKVGDLTFPLGILFSWPILRFVSSQYSFVVNLFNHRIDDVVITYPYNSARSPLIVNGQKCVPKGTVL